MQIWKLFADSETSFLQVFPLDSRREGLREIGWVIICRHFERKATTYYVGRLYLLSFMFPRNEGLSLNFLAVAYTLYSRVITTFLFAKVVSAIGMTAKHQCPIFLDSLWQPSYFIAKMGIPYTLPENYLLFIPMALTAFLGKEKVYTRQDMGIKKSSHESSNRTKEKCLTTLRKSI